MNKKFTKLIAALALLVFMMPSLAGWGQTRTSSNVTYTISSKNTLTTTGTAPSGSAATIVETYSTSQQMTNGNSQTLTLSGYKGYRVTNITLSMHSNKSAGAGKLSYSTNGGTSYTYIVGDASTGVAFNQSAWNGSWSQDWVDISKDVEIEPTSSNFIIKIEATVNSLYCQSYTLTYEEVSSIATPWLSVRTGYYDENQSVTITCETEGAAIYYTTDGTTPTANSTAYNGAISINGTNFNGESTTLKAIAIKDNENSAVATATYTFVTPLATMDEIFSASSTSGSYYVKFNNYVVSGKNTGNPSTRAYVTDGTKGFCIYNNTGHNFNAGDKINGIIQCTLTRSSGGGFAQINNITRSTAGLTVTTDGTITPTNIAIANLTGVNTGAVMSYTDLSYTSSGATLSDGEATIKAQADLMSLSGLFTDGKKYHVTGVYINYTNYSGTLTKQLCPRSTADIVLAAQMTAPTFPAFAYVVGNDPDTKNVAISGSDFLGDLTVTAPDHYEVSSDGSTWGATATYTPASNAISGTLHVRLKSGLSAGTYNETLKLTATNLTTINVALEGTVTATQTYAITLSQPEVATISAVEFAEENDIVTLSYADVDECYSFTSWSVYKTGDQSTTVTVDGNQFTMPAYPVTVSATFTKNTYTLDYYVNGNPVSQWHTDNIDCGTLVTVKTAAEVTSAGITMPAGYSFAGWSAAVGSTTTVSSVTVNSNTSLYAVLLPENAPVGYVKVTSLQDITAGTYFIVNDGHVLPSATTTSSPVQEGYAISLPLSNSYNSLPVAGTEWTFTGSSYSEITIKNSENKYLYVAGTSSNAQIRVNSTSDTWAFETNGTGFAMKDANNSRYCATYTSNTAADWRSYSSANHSNYGDGGVLYLYKKVTPATYTLIEDITSPTATLSSIEPSYLITVENGGVLTLTGPNNGDASNLVIKDGAQLKVYTTGARDGEVQATVEKYIDHYTAANNGWNFIASPLTSAFAPDATMTSNTYDLYQLNNTKWENYKDNEGHTNANPGFSLVNGHGYLYANSENVTLSFPGAVKPFNTVTPTANQVAVSAGWNLIGNPYTFNVFVNQPYYSISQAQAGITAQTTASNTDDIAPCTAVLVKANEAGYVTFYETLPSTSNNGNLNLVVAQAASNRGNATTIDNAIVSFNEGDELEKFYFGSQNANIYIPQGVEEYAIATSNAQGEMPVNFRANENGEYTLTVNVENVEMNYLHLIDNMTGADIDLLSSPSYTFNAKTTDYESRFRLVFASATMNEDSDNETFAFFSNDQLVIINEGQATLQVIDVNGRILRNETINGSTNVSMSNTPGVYMLRLINGSDVKVQKIVVK